jgi:TonB family protein
MIPPAITLLLILVAAQVTPRMAVATNDPPTTLPPSRPSASKLSDIPSPAPIRRPNPDSSGRYHVGDGVLEPKLLYQVEPQFTKAARKKKVSGIVLVSLIVGTDGLPTNVSILRSIGSSVDKKHLEAALSLDEAALEAVKKYKFSPATYRGTPVPVELHVEVNFQIF